MKFFKESFFASEDIIHGAKNKHVRAFAFLHIYNKKLKFMHLETTHQPKF
jgi:hypothetical protein